MIVKGLKLAILLFFLFSFTSSVLAQDTLRKITSSDTTFLRKTQKFYNKMFYTFYGRFVQGGTKRLADTNYIRSYPEYFTLSVGLGYPSMTYDVVPSQGITTNYIAYINNALSFKFGYKRIGFGYTVKIKSNIESSDYLAPTSFSSFNLKFQNNRLNHAIGFSHVQGLTDISSDQNGGIGKSGYIKREDMVLNSLSYELVWNLGWKKYSYLAPNTYGQRQLKSRLGFMMKGAVVMNTFEADSAIINPQQQQYYGNFKDVSEFAGVAFKFAPGIGGNLVFAKRLYIAGLLFAGADFYKYNYQHSGNTEKFNSSSIQFVIDGEASIGYQTERFFSGAVLEWKSLNTKVNDASIIWYNWYAGIKVGYRFKAPSLLKKSYQVIFPY